MQIEVIKRLQSVQNTAARLVTAARRRRNKNYQPNPTQTPPATGADSIDFRTKAGCLEC